MAGTVHQRLILTTTLIGAALLIASDIMSRLVLSPQEIPVGIVTTFICAVFVFVLLIGTRRRDRTS